MPPLPPTDVLVPVLLRDVLAPAAIAAWTLFRCAVWRRNWLGSVGAVLALAAGLALGNWLREVLPWQPEKQSWQWLPCAAGSVMLIGLLVQVPKIPRPDRWFFCALASLLAAWLLMPTEVETFPTWVLWLFGLVIFAEWVVLDALAKGVPGGAVPTGLTILLLAAATVLLYAGSARFADILIIMAASFAGIALVAWVFRVDMGAAAPAGIVFLVGLLFEGYSWLGQDSKVPLTSFLLPALAPLAAVLMMPLLLLPDTRRRSLLLQALFLVLILIPAIVAVVLAMHAESLPEE